MIVGRLFPTKWSSAKADIKYRFALLNRNKTIANFFGFENKLTHELLKENILRENNTVAGS